MRIDKLVPHLLRVYTEQAQKQQQVKTEREQASEVNLSREAKELQEYRARLRELPDVREKLVEDLREKVEAGTYRPDAKRIAEGIIEERRLDRKV